ncbi:MAG: preprotein translocase subunit SecY [Candidatus Portnoybacteria bacterium CG06_land_8_20_14_3_00_39_12]|uniref:Protein translocase subunit SecY n=1 Tax=Candidatus Portnoybacteria bacterium CG06_land_8_20_14_3_00_39_12 TaxID=1974809 RepID=A0A2M7AXG9_9BACT|nr:MAG: preprotein translocase subunit SecY [Candidatus Portnoybacteria bacterium CG06_land_8_20_14_3_00_39_12]
MFFQKIVQIFKIHDLRNKIIFVLAMLMIFRVAANIPVPGVDASKLKEFFGNNQFFGLLNIFTGGALSNFSLAMLGLGPYITATIILQLLTMIFPRLEEIYKEQGEAGRRKFNQYGRLLTVPLAALQGYAMLTLFSRQGVIVFNSWVDIAVAIVTVVAGTVFLMWIGELISEKGIGNGVSLLIFAGIIAGLPSTIREIIVARDPSKIPSYIAFVVVALLVIAAVVLINEGKRNIPVSYAKRIRGRRMYGGVSTYLPISVNPAGVIPIIFAVSIMLMPGMVANFITNSSHAWLASLARQLAKFSPQNLWLYAPFYFLLVVVFTFFYTAVTFEPKNISSNLQKMGGFIPGIRPGRATSEFLHFILNRLLLFGAIFLGAVAVLPSIIQSGFGFSQLTIGGTAVLIVVSVVLETMRQVESQLTVRDYEGF